MMEDYGISTFPNPAFETVTIPLPVGVKEKVSVLLRNVQGNIVFENTFSTMHRNNLVVDMHHLPAGMYFLQLKTDGCSFTGKMLKQ